VLPAGFEPVRRPGVGNASTCYFSALACVFPERLKDANVVSAALAHDAAAAGDEQGLAARANLCWHPKQCSGAGGSRSSEYSLISPECGNGLPGSR
jgi:hypothetical protein